ncbi:MAG: MarR family transcriptional regulator [Bacteroidota bacterium]
MDEFMKLAEQLLVYRIRFAWHEIARMYNDMASEYDVTLSMGFILLTINEEYGTPVTKIAPRMGMKPNSLSRILRSMEDKGLVFRKKDEADKRLVYICLTDLGKDRKRIALDAVFRLNNALIKDLPPEKINAFFEVMDQVPKAVEEMREAIKNPSSNQELTGWGFDDTAPTDTLNSENGNPS